VLAIVPALDEQETVGDVVATIRSRLVMSADIDVDVLVVDDGSSDRTATVARSAGATVVRHPFNLGVGAALRTGFRYAHSRGSTMAMQIDADGQHDPTEAARLLDAVAAGADLAIGSRFAPGSGEYEVSTGRRFSMRLLSGIVSRRIGQPITDTTSGYRAFSARAIELFADEYPSAYLSDTVESLLIAHYAGLRIVEVPVAMRERMGGVASNNVVRSGYHVVRLMLVIALARFRRPVSTGS
jgi:glycosyltransferase involved in cell wall biosynthesis